ncbi:unannotated protein [freshwater metagenome]|uniref:Unannotated protein n=1 Tax=freshwater metagenome TaxID=449393 RepID=A0A6J6BHQ0_9ZZZZ
MRLTLSVTRAPRISSVTSTSPHATLGFFGSEEIVIGWLFMAAIISQPSETPSCNATQVAAR